MDIEEICAGVHKAYCDERIKQGREPYWTGGDYNKLDESTKDYDRKTVKAVLKAIGFEKLQAETERLKEACKAALDYLQLPELSLKENLIDILTEFLTCWKD